MKMKVVKIVLLLMFCSGPSVLLGMTDEQDLFDSQAQLEVQKKRMAIFVAQVRELIAKDDAVVIDHCKDCKGACVSCAAKDDALTPFKGSARLLARLKEKFLDRTADTWTDVEKAELEVQEVKRGAKKEPAQEFKEGKKTGTEGATDDDNDVDAWFLCEASPTEVASESTDASTNAETTESVEGLTQDMTKLEITSAEDLARVVEVVELKDPEISDEDIALAIEPFLKALQKHLAAEFDKKDMSDDERTQLKKALEKFFSKESVIEAIALRAMIDEAVMKDRATQSYDSAPVKIAKAVLPTSRDMALLGGAAKAGFDIAQPHVMKWYNGLTPMKVVSLIANHASGYFPQVKAMKLGLWGFNTLQGLVTILIS